MGGNRKTILVMISGAGCAAAKAGWQEELYEWSQDVPRFRYTRIDVAHDDFEGEYDVNMAIADYRDGAFSCGGRMPSVEQRGNWLNEKDKSGRSVYIGKRKNGKVCRVYEKGRQLGDSSNPWVRIECEWHNTRRIIPLDIVIEPGKYLAGAYPAFFWIYKTTERIRTTAKEAKILYEQAIGFARQQFGKLIWYMGQVENSIQDVFDMLAIPGEPPKRLIMPDYWDSILPVHAFPRK
jgi:phage replication initiation protein